MNLRRTMFLILLGAVLIWPLAGQSTAAEPTRLEVGGWWCQVDQVLVQGTGRWLKGVTVVVPSIMNLAEPGAPFRFDKLELTADGTIISQTPAKGPVHLASTNGHPLTLRSIQFDNRGGFTAAGEVQLPEGLGGAVIAFGPGEIELDRNGALTAQKAGLSLQVQKNGLDITIKEIAFTPQGPLLNVAELPVAGNQALAVNGLAFYASAEFRGGQEWQPSTTLKYSELFQIQVRGLSLSEEEGLSFEGFLVLNSDWADTSVYLDQLDLDEAHFPRNSHRRFELSVDRRDLGIRVALSRVKLDGAGLVASLGSIVLNRGALVDQSWRLTSVAIDPHGRLTAEVDASQDLVTPDFEVQPRKIRLDLKNQLLVFEGDGQRKSDRSDDLSGSGRPFAVSYDLAKGQWQRP